MKLLRRIGLSLAVLFLAAAGVLLWAGLRPPPPLPPAPKPFPPAAPVSGAAVYYNKAFAAMPKLTEAEHRALLEAMWGKLEVPERELAVHAVERFGPSLDLIAQGTREPGCEWGIDLNEGVLVKLPQLSPEMKCVQALAARARLRMEGGEGEAAANDLLAGFRLGRDMEKPSLLVSLLVRGTTDIVLLKAAGRGLAELDAPALERLEKGIRALPPAVAFADSVELKRLLLSKSVHAYVNRIKTDEQVCEFADAVLPAGTEEELKAASGKQLDAWIDATAADYAAIALASCKPFLEARLEIEAILGKKNLNPLEATGLNVVYDIYKRGVRTEAFWAVFRAALDARLRHPGQERARVAAVMDPLTGKPVACREVPGGVEVEFSNSAVKKPAKFTLLLDSPAR